MSDSPDAGAPAADAAAKKNVMLFVAIGAAAGAGAGLFGIAPRMLPKTAAAAPAAHEEKKAEFVVYAVDNLVLNPAGTEGSRFLMVSASFQLKDAAVEAEAKSRAPEVRDRVLGILGRKTINELTDVAHRDIVKKEVLDSVSAMFKKGDVVKLYFPQFVVQ